MRRPVKGTAESWVDDAVDPELKGRPRAKEKVANDYAGDAAHLKDLARLTLKFKSFARLLAALPFLEEKFDVVVLKNKFGERTKFVPTQSQLHPLSLPLTLLPPCIARR